MLELKKEIAELYFLTGTVNPYGEHELSAHRDDPCLPLSPWYMHYPKEGEAGYELLPVLHQKVGEAFFEICWIEEDMDWLRVNKIAAAPNGANPLAIAHAEHYEEYRRNSYYGNLIRFSKFQVEGGDIKFNIRGGQWTYGDNLIIEEDHISSARNTLKMVALGRRLGFTITHALAVVDRLQGARKKLKKQDVDLIAILTSKELLQHGVEQGHLTQDRFELIEAYRLANQL